MAMTEIDFIFQTAGQLAMLGWVMLLLLPRKWPFVLSITGWVIPALISIPYSALILVAFLGADGGFGSFADVKSLFQDDRLLLAGWLHYLAFDLVIGTLVARQADEMKISRILQTPLLIMCFMLGPFGFLIFALMKLFYHIYPTPKEVFAS
jgi:ABA DEFICIENT 4-like